MKYAVEFNEDVRKKLLSTIEQVIAFGAAKQTKRRVPGQAAPQQSVLAAADARMLEVTTALVDAAGDTDVAINAATKAAGGPLQLGKSKPSGDTPSGPGAEGTRFIPLDAEAAAAMFLFKTESSSSTASTSPAVAGKNYNIHIHIHLPTE